jgi:hypothetical protein
VVEGAVLAETVQENETESSVGDGPGSIVDSTGGSVEKRH